MNRKRLLWKVAPPYLAITLLAVIATGWLAEHNLKNFYLRHTRDDLEQCARLIERELPPSFPSTATDSLEALCLLLKPITMSRITMVAKDGRVLGDSDADPRTMENHASHPEVAAALAGQPSFDVRYSITLHQNLMYYALPVRRDSQVLGVLRTAVPLTTFETELHSLVRKIALGGVLIALAAAAVTLILSRRLSRPITRMVEGAERYATGDFSQSLALPDTAELATLGQTLNHMADELDRKIAELTTQRNEQESVLSSMGEGVLAVSRDEHVLFMNRAAQELLGADGDRARGRLLQETVRSSELQSFIAQMLEKGQIPAPRDITLPARQNQVLQISGSFLRGPNGRRLGALVVLNDITRLRRLEGMRRDFVANVSHELKTPITTIKGFVETLREGALEDTENARQFLQRIGSGVDRLNAIIDDLLNLSRIEQDTEHGDVQLEPGSVSEVVRSAVASCAALAEEKSIRVEVRAEKEVTSLINPTLLEQAVVNLLDNAIKYSEPGNRVEVEVLQSGKKAEIRVRDYGCGISEQHLPRLFERFYRVDKARSRKLGGTGLGLAIVKHIAQAHDGQIAVESASGKGSTFTLTLPVLA